MLSIIKQALTKTQSNVANPQVLPTTKRASQRGRQAREQGYVAEDTAVLWLQSQGLRIVARNVRYTFGELDIVAWHGDVLVLFEVRLRRSTKFGGAASSITPRKQARILAAAQAYTAKLRPTPPLRIDVVTLTHAKDPTPHWIQNAIEG